MTVRSLLCKRSLHVRIFLREGVCVSSVCVRRETGRRGAAPAAGAARALGSASGLSRGVSGARLLRRTLRRRHGHGDVGSSLELLYPDRAFVKIVWREGFLCEGCLRADRRAVCLASGQTDPPHDSPHATRTGRGAGGATPTGGETPTRRHSRWRFYSASFALVCRSCMPAPDIRPRAVTVSAAVVTTIGFGSGSFDARRRCGQL